jgi:hypothetical protein
LSGLARQKWLFSSVYQPDKTAGQDQTTPDIPLSVRYIL